MDVNLIHILSLIQINSCSVRQSVKASINMPQSRNTHQSTKYHDSPTGYLQRKNPWFDPLLWLLEFPDQKYHPRYANDRWQIFGSSAQVLLKIFLLPSSRQVVQWFFLHSLFSRWYDHRYTRVPQWYSYILSAILFELLIECIWLS